MCSLLVTTTVIILDGHTNKRAMCGLSSYLGQVQELPLTVADQEAQAIIWLVQSPQVRGSMCLWLCIKTGNWTKHKTPQLCGWAKIIHSITSYKDQDCVSQPLVFQCSHDSCYGSGNPWRGGVAGNSSRALLEPTTQQAWWASEERRLVIPDEKNTQ